MDCCFKLAQNIKNLDNCCSLIIFHNTENNLPVLFVANEKQTNSLKRLFELDHLPTFDKSLTGSLIHKLTILITKETFDKSYYLNEYNKEFVEFNEQLNSSTILDSIYD